MSTHLRELLQVSFLKKQGGRLQILHDSAQILCTLCPWLLGMGLATFLLPLTTQAWLLGKQRSGNMLEAGQ